MHILSLGGIIQQLFVPDAEGNIDNVVLGFDTLSDYLADDAYIGAVGVMPIVFIEENFK